MIPIGAMVVVSQDAEGNILEKRCLVLGFPSVAKTAVVYGLTKQVRTVPSGLVHLIGPAFDRPTHAWDWLKDG